MSWNQRESLWKCKEVLLIWFCILYSSIHTKIYFIPYNFVANMILSMSKVKLRFNTTFYWDCSANLSFNFLSFESDIGTQNYMEWNKSLCKLRSIRYRIDLTAPPCIFIMIPSDSNSLIQILSVSTLPGMASVCPCLRMTSRFSRFDDTSHTTGAYS